MEIITSVANPRLKLVRKLAQRRGRLKEGAFAVEGEDAVLTGIEAGWAPRFLLYAGDDPPSEEFQAACGTVEAAVLDQTLLSHVANLAHPPRVIGVFDLPDDVVFDKPTEALTHPSIYLGGMRDPGNVGTSLRTAVAMGVTRVGLGPNCADPFSPKAARASMGAIFHAKCEPVGALSDFAWEGQLVVALDSEGATPIHEIDLGPAPIICVGAERSGLADDVRAHAGVVASIPQQPGVESLNAATALAMALYEWRRQLLTS